MMLYYGKRIIVWDIGKIATISGKNTKIASGFSKKISITISNVGEEKIKIEEKKSRITAILYFIGDNGSLFNKNLPAISDCKFGLSLAFQDPGIFRVYKIVYFSFFFFLFKFHSRIEGGKAS
jgi:hypothetical protein